MPLRIILVDDHALLRAGIRLLLKQSKDIEVIAEAASGRDAIALVRKHRPQIVLMDIEMPELNGVEATGRIAKAFPAVRIIILSSHSDERNVLDAMRAGAAGYLLKSATAQELEMAIRAAAKGDTYLSPEITRHLIARSANGARDAGLLDRLTSRQREVLQLIAEGRSTKEIAFLLNVSVKTVETHRAQLMERLDIHDVPGLVRCAICAGLISCETPDGKAAPE